MKKLEHPKKYSGRWFTPEDINKINELISASANATRVALSQKVCESFGWYKKDGGLKEMSCRVAMLSMHRESLIKLPPPRNKNGVGWVCKKTSATDEQPLFSHRLKEIGQIQLE